MLENIGFKGFNGISTDLAAEAILTNPENLGAVIDEIENHKIAFK